MEIMNQKYKNSRRQILEQRANRYVVNYNQFKLAGDTFPTIDVFQIIGQVNPTNPKAKSAFDAIDRVAADYESKIVFS